MYQPDTSDISEAAEAVKQVESLLQAARRRISDLEAETSRSGRYAIASEVEETLGYCFAETSKARFALTRKVA